MSLSKRIGTWFRSLLGISVAGSAASLSSAQQTSHDGGAIIYRLTWFELQINPMVYRFAYAAGQPMLISLPPEGDQKGSLLLVRPDHVPEVFDRTVEQLDALLRRHGIRQLPMRDPEQAFAEEAMKRPSVHLRFAYSDGTRWAGAYSRDAVPPEINQLLAETQSLARDLVARQSNQTIDGDRALEHLKAREERSGEHNPDIVLKLRISTSGVITVNEQTMTLGELEHALDALKERNGTVWYYREAGDSDPPSETLAIIKQVLDAVVARRLPIKLQEQPY